MRKSRNPCRVLPAVVLASAFSLLGCESKEAGPPTEGGENSPASSVAKAGSLPLDQQIEQKLDPLTKEDVELYLKVMRAAGNRVKNPTPADRVAIEGAKKILAASASGRVPTPDDVKTMERANLVALAMDQIVADEMKLDARTYRGIVEAVESVVPNPASVKIPGSDDATVPDHPLTPLEKRIKDVNDANDKFLTPYRDEIQGLIAVVRNPSNLPK